VVLLVPMCTTIFLIVSGSEAKRPGSFSRMAGVIAPVKQCVTALTKWIFEVDIPQCGISNYQRSGGMRGGRVDGHGECHGPAAGERLDQYLWCVVCMRKGRILQML